MIFFPRMHAAQEKLCLLDKDWLNLARDRTTLHELRRRLRRRKRLALLRGRLSERRRRIKQQTKKRYDSHVTRASCPCRESHAWAWDPAGSHEVGGAREVIP